MHGRRVYLETFGCQMNELDSELVVGQLANLGYQFTSSVDDADVVLYNTCSVREQAEQKVWSRLGELRQAKADRPEMVVGVLGCMAERDGTDLMDRMPVVDVMCGPAELDKLPSLIDNAVRTRQSLVADDPKAALKSVKASALQGDSSRRSGTLAAAGDSLEYLDLSRSVSPIDPVGSLRKSAYVRITRGCNKFCTYCVVPFTRGAEIHRPPAHIIEEVQRLADQGITEITLLGQTVNHYRFEHDSAQITNGITQPQKGQAFKGGHRRDPLAGKNVTTFADLLYQLHEKAPSVQRLRFVTSYPRDFGDDVLEVIRDCPRLCRYLHVPAQTGSDRMLKKMNRGYTVDEYNEFIDRARHHLHQPEIGRPLMISGDIIVGFPTETDEDFAQTVELLERSRYKSCFIFKYSPRPGTVAYDKIPDDIPNSAKRERNNALLAIQNRISDEVSKEQVGCEFDIMIEGPSQHTIKASGLRAKKASSGIQLTIGGKNTDEANDYSVTAVLDQVESETIQFSGRTDGDQIVMFDAPTATAGSLPGQIRRVRITDGQGLSLFGELIDS
ncbi:MAG: tRNA (N6-isopentenyl adenosine(37)-C2)-methylthiotransferase MiaB [Phycisphaera sp.]|nr:MAG: tRNA (N6-isopentenyl adenosine(37)-C2)-methylthiotransferase MiaB [Phycisphaera sp.]